MNTDCPWCGKAHTPKKGRVNDHCKCEDPVFCECNDPDYTGKYCPKCGAWYGCAVW